jgi:aminopeptidase
MIDPRTKKLANLLVTYCVEVKPGDRVFISGGMPALPLITEIYREVIHAGGHPMTNWNVPALQEIMLKEGNDTQLQYIPEPIKMVIETFECTIGLWADENTRALSGVDPARQQMAQAAGAELSAIHMRRSASGELRWVGALYPTNAHAQDADMSLSDFADFVYSACYVDKDDPVAEWHRIHNEQQKLVDWLAGKKRIVVKGPNADLTLSIEGRGFINSDGHKNMPSGEIFTSPVEDSVNGWVRFTYPAITGGREVEGIELRFEDGKVVEATAKKNQEFLLRMLDTDAGARYLGEFAIGTNYGIKQFTKSILFDEKIGGTMHMAIGHGFAEIGGKNESAVHWDMICDMRDGGKIWVDDELFYDSGEFKVI